MDVHDKTHFRLNSINTNHKNKTVLDCLLLQYKSLKEAGFFKKLEAEYFSKLSLWGEQ